MYHRKWHSKGPFIYDEYTYDTGVSDREENGERGLQLVTQLP